MATHVTSTPEQLPPIVLIVEDDDDTRDLYETALETHGMWSSCMANVDDALAFAEDMRPDAILSDVGLGAATGVELAARLRTNARTARIPILAVTGRDLDTIDAPKGLFDDILQKPVSLPVLIARLRRLVALSADARDKAEKAGSRVPAVGGRGTGPFDRAALRGRAEEENGASAVRTCPSCAAALRWVEQRQILGVVFDYYAACANGCGLFCYDCTQRKFITLIG